MFITIITVPSLVVALIFQSFLNTSTGAIFNNRLSNHSNVHLSNQKILSRQTFPLIINSTTSPNFDLIYDKPLHTDHRWKSNSSRNQSFHGVNAKGKFKQNHSLLIQFPAIDHKIDSLQLLKQHPSLGQVVSSLRSPEDPIADSMVESVDWDLGDEAKNEMSKETMDSEDIDEDDASEDDLMVAESDDDYSNELYFSGNVDQLKANDSTSVKPSFPNETMKVTIKANNGNYIGLGKLDLINPINESTLGPLILTKLLVERSDQKQKSLRFPLMMPRSSHRNVTRLREGCSSRPSDFSRPKTVIIHWKHDNL